MKSCLGGWDGKIVSLFLALGLQVHHQTTCPTLRLLLAKRLDRVVPQRALCILQDLLFVYLAFLVLGFFGQVLVSGKFLAAIWRVPRPPRCRHA